MSSVTKIMLAAIAGIIIGVVGVTIVTDTTSDNTEPKQKQPLYWVAPMDSNFRRDGPGKSPMGMDLVPVYEEDLGADQAPGTVTINPNVVNNLGVRTAEAVRSRLPAEISTVGFVQYNEDSLFHIHSRLEGWIEKLYVKAVGDPVKQGQALYNLYSPELVNVQEEYLLALKSNQSPLIAAAKNKLRALKVSPQFIKELTQSKQVSQTVTFYSPGDGYVDHLSIREGYFVRPDQTMFSIAQLDQVWVETEVFERDAARLATGQPVSMTLDYLPDSNWQGKIDYVYPTLNKTTRTLPVRLVFDNPDMQLKPNMFTKVTIHTEPADDVLIVPKESVIRTGKQDRVVLELDDGQFKSVQVSIGRVGDDYIEVVDGIEPGDVVVTSAQFLIDSESSKTSDFKRMSTPELPSTAWAEGTINDIMVAQRMLNISHGPIDDLQMMGMTMNFLVADDIEMSQFTPGQSLHFQITKTDSGMYEIITIDTMAESDNTTDGEQQKSSDSETSGHHHHGQSDNNTATITGTIKMVLASERMISVAHDPIEAWGMAGMTMFFTIDPAIAMDKLKAGQEVEFEAYQTDTGYMVTNIHITAAGRNNNDSI